MVSRTESILSEPHRSATDPWFVGEQWLDALRSRCFCEPRPDCYVNVQRSSFDSELPDLGRRDAVAASVGLRRISISGMDMQEHASYCVRASATARIHEQVSISVDFVDRSTV